MVLCPVTNPATRRILVNRQDPINSRQLPLAVELRKGHPQTNNSNSSNRRRSSSSNSSKVPRDNPRPEVSRPQVRPIRRRRRINSNHRPEVTGVVPGHHKQVRRRRLRRPGKLHPIKDRRFQGNRDVPVYRRSRRPWHRRTRATRRSVARTSSMDTTRAIRRQISRIKVNLAIHRTVHQTLRRATRRKATTTAACHRPRRVRFRRRARRTQARVRRKALRAVPSRATTSKGHRTLQHHSPTTGLQASILRRPPAALRCHTPIRATEVQILRTRTVSPRQATRRPVANPDIRRRHSSSIRDRDILRQVNRTVLRPRRSRPVLRLHRPALPQLKLPERRPTQTNPARPQVKLLPQVQRRMLLLPVRPTFLQPRQPAMPPVRAPRGLLHHLKRTLPLRRLPVNHIRPKAAIRHHPKPVVLPNRTPLLHPRPNTSNLRADPQPTHKPELPEVPRVNPVHLPGRVPSTPRTAIISKATRQFRHPRASTSRVDIPDSISGHRTPRCRHPYPRGHLRRARTATGTDNRRSNPATDRKRTQANLDACGQRTVCFIFSFYNVSIVFSLFSTFSVFFTSFVM